jgi:hypothetical protein
MQHAAYCLTALLPYPNKKLPSLGSFLNNADNDRLSNCVLKSLSSLEGRNLHRGDGDLLSRIARVHTHASCALGNAERSEARDRERVALLQFLRDQAGHGLEGVARCALRDASGIRDVSDEVLLGHKSGRKMVKGGK